MENVVNAYSALEFFPFPQRWHSLRCGETLPAGPIWRHDAEAESISQWPWFCSRSTLLSVLTVTVTCFSLRVFTVTFLAVVVGSLYFHSGEYTDIWLAYSIFSTILYLQWIQYTIYSPYYCKLSLYFFFYKIAKFVYLVTIYYFSDIACFEVCVFHFLM